MPKQLAQIWGYRIGRARRLSDPAVVLADQFVWRGSVRVPSTAWVNGSKTFSRRVEIDGCGAVCRV
jgi:hypothetical protein